MPVTRAEILSGSRSPCGYRCTEQQRHMLRIAGSFLNTESLQDTIDMAIVDFLIRTARRVEGFADAVDAADRSRAKLR